MYSLRNDKLEKLSYSGTTSQLLMKISNLKGQQTLFERQSPEILEELKKVAVIQSTEASNSIEGIVVPNKRLKELMDEKVAPEDRSEAEIAGYRDVLETIHISAEGIPVKPGVIKQLHGDLMQYATSSGGKWKSTDNYIEEKLESGETRIRFRPIEAWKTEDAMEELCTLYNKKKEIGAVPDLVLVASFVLDFLSIHPFSDGNGRMARLLTLLLLYHFDYQVGKFISIEKVIEETKEQYYETLYISSQGWHEGEHDLTPWVDYFLTVILKSYSLFAERVGTVKEYKRGWKEERIRNVVMQTVGDLKVSQIEEKCPGISRATIQRVLKKLQTEGSLECIGAGRSAKWRKK
ncbi:Fic family protein [Bacillus nitratireducens]|uniref:Fic family protein n=1 Tax=Bacillus nitratireducens TaxID=2026193 RepID=UPI000BFA0A1C|nr:cell filamentation protein Fic [Bacillus cereus]